MGPNKWLPNCPRGWQLRSRALSWVPLAGPKPICCKWKNNKIKRPKSKAKPEQNRKTGNPADGASGNFRNKRNEKLEHHFIIINILFY